MGSAISQADVPGLLLDGATAGFSLGVAKE